MEGADPGEAPALRMERMTAGKNTSMRRAKVSLVLR